MLSFSSDKALSAKDLVELFDRRDMSNFLCYLYNYSSIIWNINLIFELFTRSYTLSVLNPRAKESELYDRIMQEWLVLTHIEVDEVQAEAEAEDPLEESEVPQTEDEKPLTEDEEPLTEDDEPPTEAEEP